ncbi:hypothetical protein RA086_07070 [Lactiplantibacillus sp. WILCCON 0030]|uniref:Integral membrane protein n=1 Tax=Lactiplantibacillus brownii TaxID=3069269 RepID=A0ABU1AAD0_9LACO|nr:hypothetical protein [Lactiplantibacillus brownii]MDQ7937387.1 hypothetical protein [Lactiplantibacillus brownii]
MCKRRLTQVVQAITLLIAIGLIGSAMVATAAGTWTQNTGLEVNLSLLWAILTLIAIVASIVFLTIWLSQRGASRLIWVFGGLNLLKVPLLLVFKIKPTSDFWNYHALAAFSAQGLTWKQLFTDGSIGNYAIFPHAINIANLFSVGAAFGGSAFIVSQLINITCTLLDMLLLYWLVARWFSRPMGIAAGLIFYWIPAYWLYSTFLNGAEPAFLTFMLIAMLALTNLVRPLTTATPNDGWANLIIAILACFAANMLRPIMSVWLIVLVLIGISWWLTNQKLTRHIVRQLGLFMGIIVVLMASSSMIYNWLYGFQVAPTRVSSAYSLATGTNPQTSGQYNADLMAKVSHELKAEPVTAKAYATVASEMQATTQRNIQELTQKKQWGNFLVQKSQNLMAENYGYNWILYNLDNAQPYQARIHWWQRFQSPLNWLAVSYFEGLMGLALISCGLGLWVLIRRYAVYLNHYFFYSALLLDGFIVSSMLVEVQGRYHIVLYLPLTLLILCGWQTGHDHICRVKSE